MLIIVFSFLSLLSIRILIPNLMVFWLSTVFGWIVVSVVWAQKQMSECFEWFRFRSLHGWDKFISSPWEWTCEEKCIPVLTLPAWRKWKSGKEISATCHWITNYTQRARLSAACEVFYAKSVYFRKMCMRAFISKLNIKVKHLSLSCFFCIMKAFVTCY